MVKVVIFGLIKSYMKEVFGLIKDKVREKFSTKLTVDMRDIGEMIKDKDKEFFLKIIQLSRLSTDIKIIDLHYFSSIFSKFIDQNDSIWILNKKNHFITFNIIWVVQVYIWFQI